MKKPIRRFITYLWTLPWDILTWLSVLFIWLCWGTKLHWLEGLWCEFKPNSWPTRTWYRVRDEHGLHIINPVELQPILGRWLTWGGTAIGHGGFYGPGRSGGPRVDTIVEEHEHIHPEQMEVSMLYGFIVQLSFVIIFLARGMEPFWVLHTTFWTISWMLIYSLSAFQAYLRGEENAYLGNIFEESAYAQTTLCEDKEEK